MRPRNRGKSSFQNFFPGFLCDSSEHVFRPRLPATPSDVPVESRNVFFGHARFMGRRPATPHSGKLFLDSVQVIVRLFARSSFGTAVSVCVISWTFGDFILTQNTSVFNLWTFSNFHSARRFVNCEHHCKGRHRCVAQQLPIFLLR